MGHEQVKWEAVRVNEFIIVINVTICKALCRFVVVREAVFAIDG